MSYDISLIGENGIVEVEQHEGEGGTYVVGGCTQADLNVTYNYAEVYSRLWDKSLRDLHGQKASETIPWLREVVEKCGARRYDDYWAPTLGNAGHACAILLRWAEQHPDAVWDVT